jgi:2-haloacid dehalogenase
MTITVVVFDAYGTLFDVDSAARRAAREKGFEALAKAWPRLAADWRAKQLQYTWLRAIIGDHCDFWQITQDGLDWALAANGLDEDTDIRDRLLDLYWKLAAYPEVGDTLAALRAAGLKTAILSNGSPAMLSAAVGSAGLESALDAVLSVEDIGIFKPDRRVYDMVGQRFDCTPDQVLFVSSNGWDASAAAGYGFHTLWVNRAGQPMDILPGRPGHQQPDLTTVAKLAAKL